MVLMHTDFPEPVLPAIRTWGMSARSAMTGCPYTSCPREWNAGLGSQPLRGFKQVPHDDLGLHRIRHPR